MSSAHYTCRCDAGADRSYDATMTPQSPEQRYPILASEDGGVRYLHFGSEWIQGAMRVSAPDALELEYTRHLVAGLAFFESLGKVQSTLQIGLGAASISKFLSRYVPAARHTVVELDPRVPRFAEQWFYFDPASVSLHRADGFEWLATSRAKFDVIITDAFDEHAKCGATTEHAYYVSVRAGLSQGGVAAFNLFSLKRRFVSATRALAAAFEGCTLLQLPQCKTGNIIVLAINESPCLRTRGVLAEHARRLRAATGLSLVTVLSGAQLLRQPRKTTRA